MDDNETGKQDDKFGDVFIVTKIKADGHLKCRIMQQIETENELLKKTVENKSVRPILNYSMSVLCIAYTLIALITAAFYFGKGAEALVSSSFLIMILLVIVTGISFLFFSVIDEVFSARGRYR